jgi:hypothetical protein
MRTGGLRLKLPKRSTREISRFPHKKRLHMPVSLTAPGRPGTRDYRARPYCLPNFVPRRHPEKTLSRLNGWPMLSPVERFADVLAGACA